MMPVEITCHFCHHAFCVAADRWSRFPRVTSDCQPARWSGELGVCPSCGLAQSAINDDWRGAAVQAYKEYDIYAAAGGAEQKVASGGKLQSRSEVLVAHLFQSGIVSENGKILDVGCGNGAFLRAFSKQFTKWQLEGSEFTRRNEAVLRTIPNFKKLHGADLADLPRDCDLLSLVHVLEHIEAPDKFLAALRDKVSESGHLFVEVPSWRENPFALMISDHASHFTPASLSMVVGSAGWCKNVVDENWVPKEISLIARNVHPERVDHVECDIAKEQGALDSAFLWLEKVMSEAKNIAAGSRNFGLFGSAIAATWLYQGIPDSVRFFVDEDPQRVGRKHLGLPILAPDEVPANADIFVGISPIIAQSLLARFRELPCRFHPVGSASSCGS